MAHLITDADTMMFASTVPWHGLGTFVGDKDVDSATALQASGLDWLVEKYAITEVGKLTSEELVEDEDGNVVDANSTVGERRQVVNPTSAYSAIVRNDTGTILGTVGRQYTPVQNVDAFAFMDAVANGPEGIRYNTAGSLRGGRTVWLLARLTDKVVRVGKNDDVTEPYLLLANTHDGRGSLRALFTTVRVVCNNTLQMALGAGTGQGIALRHTGSIHGRVAEAQRLLGIAHKTTATYQEMADAMLAKAIKPIEWSSIVELLIPTPDPNKVKVGTKSSNDQQTLRALFTDGVLDGNLMPGGTAHYRETAGTVWGALQAITAYSGHARTVRGGAEARAASKWMGSAAKFDAAGLDWLQMVLRDDGEAITAAAKAQLQANGHTARVLAMA